MRAIVDTNVIAYYLLETAQFLDEAREFWRFVKEPLAPAVWEAELANVVWMAIRRRVVTEEEGAIRLDTARRLGIESIPVTRMWQGALARSVRSGVAVYDTLFVELAIRERLPLATFDSAILAAFPSIASRPGKLSNDAR